MLLKNIGQVDAVNTATECLKSYVLQRQPNGKYAVNFRPEVWVVMQEVRHLNQLGVQEAPAAVLNVALHKVRAAVFSHSFSDNTDGLRKKVLLF